MIAPLALALAPLAIASGDTEEFEVEPIALDWSELSEATFDTRWILPDPRSSAGRDLLVEMRNLLALRFDVEMADGTRYRSFGDLVAAQRELPPSEQRDWLARFERAAPKVYADWGGGLEKLLLDDHIESDRWRPSKSHARDGLLFAKAWDMSKEERSPWTEIDVRPSMEQCATVIHADLATIKAVENDYRMYPDNVGADYEEIFPLPGSYFVGRDEDGRPFSTLTIRFRSDLPFPFSDYRTRLAILNRFDADNVLYTDIYSTSSDFYWFAGRDVFLPIVASDGGEVGFLLVRHFGFDLDGVPDDGGNRREALRASLGNLRRNAEARDRERRTEAFVPNNSPDFLHEVRVFGRRDVD